MNTGAPGLLPRWQQFLQRQQPAAPDAFLRRTPTRTILPVCGFTKECFLPPCRVAAFDDDVKRRRCGFIYPSPLPAATSS